MIERWQHSAEVELFYNAMERKLVFKKYHFIYSKGVDDLVSYPYLNLDPYGVAHSFCVFSTGDTLLAFSRAIGSIVSYT